MTLIIPNKSENMVEEIKQYQKERKALYDIAVVLVSTLNRTEGEAQSVVLSHKVENNNQLSEVDKVKLNEYQLWRYNANCKLFLKFIAEAISPEEIERIEKNVKDFYGRIGE